VEPLDVRLALDAGLADVLDPGGDVAAVRPEEVAGRFERLAPVAEADAQPDVGPVVPRRRVEERGELAGVAEFGAPWFPTRV
jgi:hypothetical protein